MVIDTQELEDLQNKHRSSFRLKKEQLVKMVEIKDTLKISFTQQIEEALDLYFTNIKSKYDDVIKLNF